MRNSFVRKNVVAVVSVFWAGSALAWATPIPVGTGASTANVEIQFGDGALYEFDVYYGDTPSATTTGLGLLDIIEANTSLTTVRQYFGSAVFIDGFTFDGHSNVGYNGDENWWHYWTKESGDSTWVSSWVGAAEREVSNGDSDGWVYGTAFAPGETPEPATAMLFGAILSLALFRKR